MRRNQWRNLPLSGFKLANQWSEAQHATAGLRRPLILYSRLYVYKYCIEGEAFIGGEKSPTRGVKNKPATWARLKKDHDLEDYKSRLD